MTSIFKVGVTSISRCSRCFFLKSNFQLLHAFLEKKTKKVNIYYLAAFGKKFNSNPACSCT